MAKEVSRVFVLGTPRGGINWAEGGPSVSVQGLGTSEEGKMRHATCMAGSAWSLDHCADLYYWSDKSHEDLVSPGSIMMGPGQTLASVCLLPFLLHGQKLGRGLVSLIVLLE
jgi:hypothetical protein